MTKWTNEQFDRVEQAAVMAADGAYFRDSARAQMTMMQATRVQVRAALECLIGNGIVEPVDPEKWPQGIRLDPPYDEPVL
jgi:hypothetical protein